MMTRGKNLCLDCWYYNKLKGKCEKPLNEGWCKITRSK